MYKEFYIWLQCYQYNDTKQNKTIKFVQNIAQIICLKLTVIRTYREINQSRCCYPKLNINIDFVKSENP